MSNFVNIPVICYTTNIDKNTWKYADNIILNLNEIISIKTNFMIANCFVTATGVNITTANEMLLVDEKVAEKIIDLIKPIDI